NDVVTERVPSEVGENPMVLVAIVAVMGKNQIRLDLLFQPFEELFNRFTLGREKAVPEIFDYNPVVTVAVQKSPGASSRLPSARGLGAEHDPPNVEVWPLAKKF